MENEHKIAVIHIGGLEECKFAIKTLETAGLHCVLDIAEKFGDQYANKGYYVVAVPEDQVEIARASIEKQLREDLNIEVTSDSQKDDKKCPACGAERSIERQCG